MQDAKQMTKKVLNDGHHGPPERQRDWVLEMNLREWMTAKLCVLNPAVQQLLKQLYEFARRVHSLGFGPVLNDLTAGIAVSVNKIDVTEMIADRLCQGICAPHDVERKSLQETLYFSTGIDPDLSASEFGERLESFLALRGSKGLIGIFLSTYLSNSIVNDLRDSLRSSPEVLCGRFEAIERICRKAATMAVRPLNVWSEPDPSWMAALLSDLKTRMAQASTSALRWKRITRSSTDENSSGKLLDATSRFNLVPRQQ